MKTIYKVIITILKLLRKLINLIITLTISIPLMIIAAILGALIIILEWLKGTLKISDVIKLVKSSTFLNTTKTNNTKGG